DLSAPRHSAVPFGRARIRITWDDRPHPSIDAPISLFFGAGTLYNRDDREHLVRAFPLNIRYGNVRVNLSCYFPMPFFKSARIELTGMERRPISGVKWQVRLAPFKDPPHHVGYF